MIKKTLTIMLTVIIALCAVPFTAYAAPALSVSLHGETVSSDTVELYIRSDNGYITSGRFMIGYSAEDVEFLSYSSLNSDDLLYVSPIATQDNAVVYFACAKSVHNKDFAKITFRIKNYGRKQTPFTITAFYLYAVSSENADVASLASASYSGCDVALPEVDRIVVNPVNSNFAVGERSEILPSDVAVTAYFKDGRSLVLPASAVKVGGRFDGTKPGMNYMNCVAGGKVVYFTVQVYDEKAQSAKVTQNPDKTVFAYGEETDFSGVRLRITYPDGRTKTVSRTETVIKGYDPYKSGEQTVTLCYANVSATIKVTVLPARLRGDADGDGDVDVADARLALRGAIGLEKWGSDKKSAEYIASDVDGLEGLSVADARLILRVAIRLEEFK